jgi:KUP system potassium uptake protein
MPYEFAKDKNITLMDGSNLLHLFERLGYSFRIELAEARQIAGDNGGGLLTLMLTWRRGSRQLAEKSRAGLSLSEFLLTAENGSVQRVPATAIFLTGNSREVPAALLHNVKHNMVLHKLNYILTVETADIPRVDDRARLSIEKLSESFSRVTLRFGFMEAPNVPKALASAGFEVEKMSFFCHGAHL